MKRIAAFVFAFLAVWYLQATDADAQFRRECRAGFCVPGGGPSGNPISNACINSSGTTITFTAQGVGGANPTRVSVVSINWSDSTAAGTAELTAMTIGGITMTRAVRASGDNQNSNSEIWYAANPTGTSANVVATFSTAVDGITIEVYRLVGYLSVTAATTGTTSVSQAYTNKQLAIAAGSRTTNVSTSLSNMVNDYSSACGANLWGVHASQKLSGNGTLTSAISPTSSNPKIALAVWSTTFCAEYTAFLARTTGMNATHQTAYQNLICGLVTDGVWSKLDILYIFATQTSTIAQLNLVSSSFNATIVGSPTFTADLGYNGTDNGVANYINTTFNPTTASSPKFTQNSAHMALWSTVTTTSTNAAAGGQTAGHVAYLYTKFSGDSSAYSRINNSGASGPNAVAGNPKGLEIGNRSGASATQLYLNNALLQSAVDASVTSPNLNFSVLGANNNGVTTTVGNQYALYSNGSSLTGTDVTNYTSRVNAYMATFGITP